MHILLAADLPWPGGWGGHRYVASQCLVQVTLLLLPLLVRSNKKGNNKINFACVRVSLGWVARSGTAPRAVDTRHHHPSNQ